MRWSIFRIINSGGNLTQKRHQTPRYLKQVIPILLILSISTDVENRVKIKLFFCTFVLVSQACQKTSSFPLHDYIELKGKYACRKCNWVLPSTGLDSFKVWTNTWPLKSLQGLTTGHDTTVLTSLELVHHGRKEP